MVSPLKAIRKYQQRMMVFFGVLLMVAFILSSVITSQFGRPPESTGPATSVAVQWDGASYSQEDLERFRQGHQYTQQFLYELYRLARVEKKADVTVDPTLMPAGGRGEGNYYSEVIILLMADEAKRMGMMVGEPAVNNFLAEVGGDEFRDIDYEIILRELTKGGFSMQRLKAQLEIELAALRLQDFLLSGMGGLNAQLNPQTGVVERQMRNPFVSPVAAAAAERRTNDTVKVQMLPLEVEKYLDKVTDSPSRSEIRQLYTLGATRNPDLEMKRPGFRQLDRARLQWFEIPLDALLLPAESITDAEVQAEYDRRVAAKDFSVVDTGTTPAGPAAPIDGLPAPPSEPAGETPPAGDGQNAPPPMTEGGAAGGAEGTPAEPATETPPPAEPAPAEPTSGEPAPSEPAPSEPAPTDPAGGGQSSRALKGQARFVSALKSQETPAEPAPQEPATEPAAEPATQEPEVTAPATTEAPAQETPAAETPAQEPTTETPATEATGTGEVQLPEPTELTTGTTPETQAPIEPKFKPLDDALKQRIREDLRRERGRVKREQVRAALQQQVTDHMLDRETYEFDKGAGVATGNPPTPPDFKAIALENDVRFGDTETMLNAEEVQQTELGKQFAPFDQMPMNVTDLPTVTGVLFGQGIDAVREYQPLETLGGTYVYWVAEKSPAHIPTLEECEKDIVRFWRWEKAVELARADAEAKLAQVTGEATLKDAFGEEVLESQPFSWWSVGGGNVGAFGGQITISAVTAVKGTETTTIDTLGNEFMAAVFSAEPGSKLVSNDYRRRTMYAVQVLEKQTTEPLSEAAVMNLVQPGQNATRIIGSDLGEYVENWFADLEKRRNVRWTVNKK